MTTDNISIDQQIINPITSKICPQCSGNSNMWPLRCDLCGGKGWIDDPFKPPKYPITTNPMDLTLSLRLDRLEEKLDRLLAALEDTS